MADLAVDVSNTTQVTTCSAAGVGYLAMATPQMSAVVFVASELLD